MHLKRSNVPKFWPIARKGTKYLALPTHNQKNSLPLVVVLRDILKIVRNKKELKRLLNEKKVEINHKKIMNVNYPISLFDVINLPDMKLNYRAMLSKNKKFNFEKISDKESLTKNFKVVDKKVLTDKKIQLNLMNGINVISKDKVNTGDSVIYDFKEKKIVKIIPMEKGKNAFVIEGKHAGFRGKIEDIVERGGKKLVKMSSGKEKINVWIKNIIVED